VPPSKLTTDPITLGEEAQIPVNSARVKIIGPSHDEVMTNEEMNKPTMKMICCTVVLLFS
jgi:hypothetical protein